MGLNVALAAMLIPLASAQYGDPFYPGVFTIYEDVNLQGAEHWDYQKPDPNVCWNLNGKGDKGSSVTVWGDGACIRFFRERDCQGQDFKARGTVWAVPDYMNDHMYSYIHWCG